MNSLSVKEFDQLVDEVWLELLPLIPDDLKEHFSKIQILIEDRASEELGPEDLCGLFIGAPLPEESISTPSLFPGQVFLFRWALEDLAEFDGTPEGFARLRDEIAITLLHEIGHFFGLSEADLERLHFA